MISGSIGLTLLTHVANRAKPNAQDRSYVDRLVPAFLDILAHEFPIASFGNLPRAMEISASLGSKEDQDVRLRQDDSLLTILNAGWLRPPAGGARKR